MATHMTILSSWLDAVVDQLARQSLDPQHLTAGLWEPRSEGIAPTRQMGLVLARRLWHRAASLSTDPLLGLKVGLGLPLQAMNATGLMMMHSATLRDALAHMASYQQLVSNSGQIGVHETTGGVELRYVVTPCHVAMHPLQIDSLFAGVLAFLGRCSMHDIAPRRIELTAPDTRLAPRYAELLGCPVVLGAAEARVVYDVHVLDTPFQGADPTLLSLVRTHADGLLRARNASDSLEATVRTMLSSRGFGGVSCADVAQSLGIAPRTLQRRLGDIGMPFRRLLEAARMDEALFLLTQSSVPLSEIADRLGYAEPSSFWHAVKSCWGATPRELRGSTLPQRRERDLGVGAVVR